MIGFHLERDPIEIQPVNGFDAYRLGRLRAYLVLPVPVWPFRVFAWFHPVRVRVRR